uniref:Metabotropic glutamate receptor n=1 Tax=Sipha flava TaxID=143950 RepID=A0A2S2R8J2_9HEMI
MHVCMCMCSRTRRLLMITRIVCTTMFQVLINGVWMLVSPPKVIHYYPNRESNILVCSSFINTSYVIAFGYPIVLIVVCTVYAVLTRNIPEAFNESKHIGKRIQR